MGTTLFSRREVYLLQGSLAVTPKRSNRREGRESWSLAITVSSIPCIWKSRVIFFTLMNTVNSTYNHRRPFGVVNDALPQCQLSAGLAQAPLSQAAHCHHYWPGAATWSPAQNPSRQHLHPSTFPSTQAMLPGLLHPLLQTLYHHSKLPNPTQRAHPFRSAGPMLPKFCQTLQLWCQQGRFLQHVSHGQIWPLACPPS